MNDARRAAVLGAALAVTLMSACGPKRVRPPERSTARGRDLIALLPDPDTHAVGRAIVSNPSGTANLAAARDSTLVSAGQAPGPVTTLSEAEVQRLFGDALSALPLAPRHFTLFFRFESDELTEESRVLVPQILQAVKDLPAPDVLVVGHTDTTGTRASNFELGLKRANTVRNLLLRAGLDASVIEVTSHGKADLLVATPDNTLEPRNRRVEITVR